MHGRALPLLCLLLAMASSAVQANDDDTRRLLNQIDRNLNERERSHLVEETPPDVDPSALITINGTTYSVDATLTDLEPAIYVAINLQQWAKVDQFVEKYQELPGHNPALVLMAQGMVARSKDNHSLAISKLRQAQESDPNMMRAKLELARLLFEDYQSSEAKELFSQISSAGIPEEVRPVIEGFQGALQDRNAWHGSASIGLGYNSNINKENGQEDTFFTCYFFGCFPSVRKMPDPVKSTAMVYDLTLNRRLQLSGNHNLLLRGLSYGNLYDKHKEAEPKDIYYSDNTSIIYAGYNYQDAKNDLSITPLFENNYTNRRTSYQSWGGRVDWKHNLSDRLQVGVNAQHKSLSYKGDLRQYFEGVKENQIGLYGSYLIDAKTVVYGGLNYTRNLQSQQTAQSRSYMANLGIYRAFDAGFNINATALYRQTRHDAEDLFLGGLRKDRQQIYILNVGMPRFAFQGITPNLYVKHTFNNSNIDWAFKYKQTEVALKLEKRF